MCREVSSKGDQSSMKIEALWLVKHRDSTFLPTTDKCTRSEPNRKKSKFE
jgi:hypothetical protein